MFAVQEQENIELLSVIQTFREALFQSKFPNFSSQRSFMETTGASYMHHGIVKNGEIAEIRI